MTPRVLALDAGMTMGFGALGGGSPPSSGSRRLRGDARHLGIAGRHCDEVVRQLILAERPDVIAFASPFVGQMWDAKRKRFIPIQPDSIRPLMSFLTIVEMICDELRIRCVEVSENECRSAFLEGKVPCGTEAIKAAVIRACHQRGWPATDDHAADSLCVASRALEIVEPSTSHETTPLFTVAKPARKKRVAKK
jgi:hypothetical protein